VSRYKEGQVWRYKTRPHEQESRLCIVKVDDPVGQPIFHIFLDGLQISNKHFNGGFQAELPHAPVDVECLDKSVTLFEGLREPMSDISEGYNIWKQEYDKGDAGVFNIAVAEIVQYIEDVVAGKADA
jgi:hypothetical protein